MSILAELERRVESLEVQLRKQPVADSLGQPEAALSPAGDVLGPGGGVEADALAPNLFVVMPNGEIQEQLAGRLVADGIELRPQAEAGQRTSSIIWRQAESDPPNMYVSATQITSPEDEVLWVRCSEAELGVRQLQGEISKAEIRAANGAASVAAEGPPITPRVVLHTAGAGEQELSLGPGGLLMMAKDGNLHPPLLVETESAHPLRLVTGTIEVEVAENSTGGPFVVNPGVSILGGWAVISAFTSMLPLVAVAQAAEDLEIYVRCIGAGGKQRITWFAIGT